MVPRLHFTLLLLLPFSLCEVSGEELMVHDQDEQIEKQLGWCPLQGTKCATLGGKCYHERIMPMVKCKGVVNNTPNICGIDVNECYCCLEYDIDGQLTNTNQCTQTLECRQGGADHGQCVADVDYYLDLETTYVSTLQCEEPHCSCLHQCQEESICRDFDGHCFLNDVTNCGKGYTMLPGCGCKNVDTCGCCVPDAVAAQAANEMGC